MFTSAQVVSRQQSFFGQVIEALLSNEAHQAVKYLSPYYVVQATRVSYRHGFSKRSIDIRITAGRPNYLARRFIKACRKAGEPFPVKRVQLRFPVKRRR